MQKASKFQQYQVVLVVSNNRVKRAHVVNEADHKVCVEFVDSRRRWYPKNQVAVDIAPNARFIAERMRNNAGEPLLLV